jgi:nitroimidazol reductase NimA-like FMN-containing flavoprotein (pyridoxamine 5'-phosphate oxidase superfamily)
MAKSIEILAEKERKKEESKQALEVLKKGRKTIWQKEKFFNLKLSCHLNVFYRY